MRLASSRLSLSRRPLVRTAAAYWLFGLINNFTTVVTFSAALDLVGPDVPKALVLLANILPSFVFKLFAPYVIHLVSYGVRTCAFVVVSTLGMLLLAAAPDSHDAATITAKVCAITLSSLSASGGELSFLALTHYYGHVALSAWGSGTGAAGIFGATAYLLATTTFGLSSRASLFLFSFLPLVMLVAYFVILPSAPAPEHPADRDTAQRDNQTQEESEGLLSPPRSSDEIPTRDVVKHDFASNLRRSRSLIIPYMIPLFLVYFGEYTINQGVAPTLLFPLSATPFMNYREFYPTYSAIYQTGVFLSRTSIAVIRVRHLYSPSLLQCANLLLLTLHALFNFLPNVWVIFTIIFWEGLLGGLVYVNAFAEISDNVPIADREYSLAATSVSDSAGICLAAVAGMLLETGLCRWQVDHGRDYCKKF